MAPRQRIDAANKVFHKNIESRGNVKKSLVKKGSAFPTDPIIVGIFVFIVCGSLIFEMVRFVRLGWGF